MRTIGSLATILALAATGGCGSDEMAERARTDDREAISTQPLMDATDRPWSLVAEHVADLVPPDSALTPVAWGVVADAQAGRIYALDWTQPRVVIFDGNANFVGEYAREGDGPGEFRNPSALAMDGNGDLLVWDSGRATISRWSPAGYQGESRVPVDLWGPGFRMSPDGALTITADHSRSGSQMIQRLVLATDGDTRTVYELPIELTPLALGGSTTPTQRILAPSIVWTSHGEEIYLLNGDGYQIDRYVGGHRSQAYSRPLPPIEVDAEMAVAAVEGGMNHYSGFLRRSGFTAQQLVQAIGHERSISPVQNLAVDHDGRLWVTRTTDGFKPSFVDVFSSSGEYEGTMRTPGVPAAFPSDSTVVMLRVESSSLPVLGLYRLVSPPLVHR